jgi:hypothetical protein
MKTAIEWLMDEIKAIDKETYATLINEGKFDKAKSINKEQIQLAFEVGTYNCNEEELAEQYYNQTYN